MLVYRLFTANVVPCSADSSRSADVSIAFVQRRVGGVAALGLQAAHVLAGDRGRRRRQLVDPWDRQSQDDRHGALAEGLLSQQPEHLLPLIEGLVPGPAPPADENEAVPSSAASPTLRTDARHVREIAIPMLSSPCCGDVYQSGVYRSGGEKVSPGVTFSEHRDR